MLYWQQQMRMPHEVCMGMEADGNPGQYTASAFPGSIASLEL